MLPVTLTAPCHLMQVMCQFRRILGPNLKVRLLPARPQLEKPKSSFLGHQLLRLLQLFQGFEGPLSLSLPWVPFVYTLLTGYFFSSSHFSSLMCGESFINFTVTVVKMHTLNEGDKCYVYPSYISFTTLLPVSISYFLSIYS